MVNPVPGRNVTTAYLARGRHWSCNRNAQGHGQHTGADIAAPAGTRVVAARPGIARHVNHGSAFGRFQLRVDVDASAGGGADAYMHMRRRTVANGARVAAGQQIGEVGSEGNSTGNHLHFWRLRNATGGWNCSNHTNPQPSINWQPPAAAGQHGRILLSHLVRGRRDSASVRFLQTHLNSKHRAGLPITGNYLDATHAAVQRCQRACGFTLSGGRVTDRVGPQQMAHLITRGCGCTIVDDR